MLRLALALAVLVGCRHEAGPPPPSPPPPPAPPALTWQQWKHMPEKGRPPAPPPRAWPSGAFDLAAALPGAFGRGDAIGTAHRVLDVAGDPHARWVIVCQQREDTDGDGKITFEQEAHFAAGDTPSSYLVFGGGAGAELDDVIATSSSGDHVVVEIDRTVLLVDGAHRTATELPGARATASFTLDGRFVEYIDNHAGKLRAVRRELATGATKAVELPTTSEARILAGGDGRWAAIAVAGEEGFGAARWISRFAGFCSMFGSLGGYHEIKLLWADLEIGVVRDDPLIVRPAGDHAFARAPGNDSRTSPLLLDGKPIGPRTCDELDVLGIVEDPPRALVNCMPDFKVSLVGAGIAARAVTAYSIERTSDPVPRVFAGEVCPPRADLCFDVATGKSYAKPFVGERSLGFGNGHYSYAFDDQHRALVGAGDSFGPLSWQPEP